MSSEAGKPVANPPSVLPVYPPSQPVVVASKGGGCGRALVVLFITGSLLLNLLLIIALASRDAEDPSDPSSGIVEKFVSGDNKASDKIAIIRVEGVIVEGLLNFVHKQIEKVARDPKVKAIVLRIDSPGGTITASQDLYARLLELRDGTHLKAEGVARPIIVSMGGVAASGGYYIAMASGTAEEGSYVMAEDITITGSIGVYVAMLNIAEFAQRYGIRMDLIKAGGIKASGSLFHEMSPQERQPWQDMIDNAYDKFLAIVATGRKGRLAKTDLEEVLNMPTPIKLYDSKGVPIKDADGQAKTVPYTRQRADGGIFTTKKAIELKLVDAQGTLKDAVAMAAKKAGLADSPYKAVKYERPTSLLESLLGVETRSAQTYLEPERLANLAIPRLWVMMPNAELSGLAATLR